MVADWGSADMSRVLPQHSGSCRSAWVPVGGHPGKTKARHERQIHFVKVVPVSHPKDSNAL